MSLGKEHATCAGDAASPSPLENLACVIVGGMLLSPICSLLVIPTVARLVMPNVAVTEPDAAKVEA